MHKADSRANLIVVSRDAAFSRRIEGFFVEGEVRVKWEPNLERVLSRFESETFDAMVVTSVAFKAGEIDGMEVLEVVSAKSALTQVLFLAEARDIDLAMSVLKTGSYQYARLPVDDRELEVLIRTALDRRPKHGINQLLKPEHQEERYDEIVGRSATMQDVYRQIRQAAETDIPVLLQGETGTGKDLVAQAIHRESGRGGGPFIPVNVGAIPAELVGSELFGHEKGSFTGAVDRREGKFEQGHEGTVFLDEVGSIDEKVQVSLLRLIEQRKFHRLGGRRLISVDVRLIAATNEDLTELVRQGRFREDLFYRLDVFRIVLPPLRQRHGDIPLLVHAFMRRYNRSFQKQIREIVPGCIGLLEAYGWPGNVRELKNVIQRAVLVCQGESLLPEHLPPRFRQDEPSRATVTFEVGTPLHEVEREMVIQALNASENNRKRAAELLGISRRSLYNKLRKYGIK